MKSTKFMQKDGESLFDAWERYIILLRLCPFRELEKLLVFHTFNNGLIYSTRMALDTAAGGAFMNIPEDVATNLIE